MRHRPSPTSASLPPYAVELAARAVSPHKIVIYAGAGVSLSPPTNLPTGATLAAAIHTRLKADFPVLTSVESSDLVAIADAVATLPGGEGALRQTSARSAQFRTAKPGYAHRALAHLMLEGAIDVVTTNWDNCIERGAGEERLPTVTNARDLAEVDPPWILKVHGCATRPDSLLLTSDHLDEPPSWVTEQTHARLGSAIVVFMGIGDVAGYVEKRIDEVIHEVGYVENIRVVAPDIEGNWNESRWKNVVPDLSPDHKIPTSADQFMEQLAAAYIKGRLGEHSTDLCSDETLAAYLEAATVGLFESDALKILQWARGVDINPRVGESVLKSSELAEVLIALGRLAGNSARLENSRIFETGQGPVEVLIATQTVPRQRLVAAAEDRLHDHANRGEPYPLFLISGGMGSIPKQSSLPHSIFGDVDDTDIVDGPLALVPNVRLADEVIAS